MADGHYIDSHLHLLDQRLASAREEVIRLAVAGGVATMICNATREEEWLDLLALAARHPQIKPSLGIHPWFADCGEDGWLQRLEHLLQDGGGVGEVGLDYLATVDRGIQERVFVAQLDLAVRLQRPVTIHCLKAWGRMLEILLDYRVNHARLLFHSFGGSREMMHKLLDLGAFFSFSAALADPARTKLRQVFMAVPLDRLLLETDAPDQYVAALFEGEGPSPAPAYNQPCHLPALYAFAARLRTIDPDVFRDTLWNNGQIFTN